MADYSDFYPPINGGDTIQYSIISVDTIAAPFKGYYVDTTAAVTVTLPAAADSDTKVFVGDGTGNAETMPITITPDGLDTIMGQTSFTINVAWQMFEFVKVGSDWKFSGGVGEGAGGGETPGGGVDPAADYDWTGSHNHYGGLYVWGAEGTNGYAQLGSVNLQYKMNQGNGGGGSWGPQIKSIDGTTSAAAYHFRSADVDVMEPFPRITSSGNSWDFTSDGRLVLPGTATGALMYQGGQNTTLFSLGYDTSALRNLECMAYFEVADYDDGPTNGIRSYVRDGVWIINANTGPNAAEATRLQVGGAPVEAGHLCNKLYTDSVLLAVANQIADQLESQIAGFVADRVALTNTVDTLVVANVPTTNAE